MTGLIHQELRGIAAALADLKVRVRRAVAGEVAGAVASAVRSLVHAAVSGDADEVYYGRVRRGWTDDGRRTWDDDEEDAPYGPRRASVPSTAIAVAAGLGVAQWCLVRGGSPLSAAGIGLAVGTIGLAGGPLALTVIAAVAAIADLLAVTDALGAAAGHIGNV